MQTRYTAVEGQRLFRFDFPIEAAEHLEVWHEIDGHARRHDLHLGYAIFGGVRPVRSGSVQLTEGARAGERILVCDTRTPDDVLASVPAPLDLEGVMELRAGHFGLADLPDEPEPAPIAEPAEDPAAKVWAEAARRATRLTGGDTWEDVRDFRASAAMELGTLNAKRLERLALTPTEQVRALELPQIEEQVRAIEAAARALVPAVPEDYTAERYWPVLFG